MRKIFIKQMLRPGETIFVNKVQEPAKADMHCHDFIELEYVLSGKGIHRVGNMEIPVGRGHVFFTNYDTPHCFISREENPIVLINCVFTPESLEGAGLRFEEFAAVASDMLYQVLFPGEVQAQPYLAVVDTSQELRRMFEHMCREYAMREEGYASVLLGCLIQALVWFMRLYQQQHALHSTVKTAQAEYVNTVLDYIQNNYAAKLSLQELARVALLSPNHLCKVFKELTGETVSEHIQHLRMEKACEILKDPHQTLEAVAEAVGYGDVGHFRRVFKKEMGKTPTTYRGELLTTENLHGLS